MYPVPDRNSRAVGVLASEEGGTGRAAQRRGRHEVCDPHTLPPQVPVQGWHVAWVRGVEKVVLVVCHDDKKVGPTSSWRARQRRCGRRRQWGSNWGRRGQALRRGLLAGGQLGG